MMMKSSLLFAAMAMVPLSGAQISIPGFPSCATLCIGSAMGKCSINDQTCLCQNRNTILADAQSCLDDSCSQSEIATITSGAQSLCASITPTATATPSSSAEADSDSGSGLSLSEGAQAGIAVGAVVLILLILTVAICCVRRHRKRAAARHPSESEAFVGGQPPMQHRDDHDRHPHQVAYDYPQPPPAGPFGDQAYQGQHYPQPPPMRHDGQGFH